ncbi:MAG: succinylglutamate desuccinylase/aspartoacylase family protein [Anaerolineae bacterium]
MKTKTIEVAGVSAAPGTKTSRVIDLTLAGVATKMPLFVINGQQDGPVVVITAAIHGSEYVGTAAATQLAKTLDPAQVHGAVVIVPVCSMTAFVKRAIYLAPPDDKNLNRCFPGKADGSFAEQLAHWITTNLISRADIYMDLHGGDMNEALVPFSIVKRTGNAELDAKAVELARIFGLPNLVVSEVKGSTVAAAADAGVLAVLTEVGGQGLWSAAEVEQMGDGLRRVMTHYGCAALPAPPAPPSRILEAFEWLRSSHDGMFYPLCRVGDEVKKGQKLGYVTDYLGNLVQEAISPCDGVVLFLVTTLAMNNNDPLLAVGA